tara:strand:+ start:1950 stop:3083 length:1134 start_codon:yes stop_codon:yes gene_type:complete
MKIEVIWARNQSAGMAAAVKSFGDKAVLFSCQEIGKKSRLLVGVDTKEVIETNMISSPNLRTRTVHTKRRPDDYVQISNLIKEELAIFRKDLSKPKIKSNADIAKVTTNMEKQGASRNLSNFLTKSLPEAADVEDVYLAIKGKLLEALPNSTDIDRHVKTHVLCGGYGSGKSTMAIKISLKLLTLCETPPVLVHYKQTKNSSKGALQEISKNLGLPIFEVGDIETLKMIEDHLTNDGILIVDTNTREIKEELAEIKTRLASVNFHLVSASDTYAAAQKYLINATNWNSIMVSRLDLEYCHWPLIETLIESRIPISLGSISPDLNSGLVTIDKEILANQLYNLLANSSIPSQNELSVDSSALMSKEDYKLPESNSVSI